MKKIYPNLFRRESIFSIFLKEKSFVTLELIDEIGKKILTVLEKQELLEGKQEIKFTGNQLKPGIYTIKATIENSTEKKIEDRNVKIN